MEKIVARAGSQFAKSTSFSRLDIQRFLDCLWHNPKLVFCTARVTSLRGPHLCVSSPAQLPGFFGRTQR